MAKLKFSFEAERLRATFYCPGCRGEHTVVVDGPGAWGYNKNPDSPTLWPSVLVTGYIHTDAPGYEYNSRVVHCHSFINDGKIQFLSDCNHELAGQTVELPEIEQWKIQ